MASPQKENGYTPISNEILEALARIRIPGEARQMLDVIIRKTYGFNKKDDKISTSQFIEYTGLPRISVHRNRRKLISMNLITVKRNGYAPLMYSFNKDFEKWKGIFKKRECIKLNTGCVQKVIQSVSNKATYKRHKDNIQKKDDSQGSSSGRNILISIKNKISDLYKQKFNSNYIWTNGKDEKLLKNIISQAGPERIIQLYEIFISTPQDKFEIPDHSIGIFQKRINRLQEKLQCKEVAF